MNIGDQMTSKIVMRREIKSKKQKPVFDTGTENNVQFGLFVLHFIIAFGF